MGMANRAATNQPPPLVGYNVVESDVCLTEALSRFADTADQTEPSLVESLKDLGELAGSAEAREHAVSANRHPPELLTHDRFGNRIDEVRFDPSWHWLMQRAMSFGLAATPWVDERPDAQVRRAARFFAWS